MCFIFYLYFDWGLLAIPFLLYFSYIFYAAITYYLLKKVTLIGLISLSALFASSVYSVATSAMVNLSRADIFSGGADRAVGRRGDFVPARLAAAGT